MSIEQRDQLVIIDHGEGDEPLRETLKKTF